MKYNAIGDLITENMELKRRLRKLEIAQLKGMISFLELVKPALLRVKGQYNVVQHIYQLKEDLSKFETLEK